MIEASKPRQQLLPPQSVLHSPPEDEEDLDEKELPEKQRSPSKKAEKYDLDKYFKNKESEEILDKYGYELPSFYRDNDDVNISDQINDIDEVIKDLKVTQSIADFKTNEYGVKQAKPKLKNFKKETIEKLKDHNILKIFKNRLEIIR